MYKITLSLLLIAFFLLSLTSGCQKSRVQSLQERLDGFRHTLPESLKADFDAKNYEVVVKGIDSLLKVDQDFKIRYEEMKDNELINVFTPEEVVDFFKTYFVEEIEKEKRSKE